MGIIFTDYFELLAKNLMTTLNTPDAYLNKVALTAITIIFGLLLHWSFKKLISRYIKKDIRRKLKLRKILRNVLIILTSILILFIWIQAINALILLALLSGAFGIVMLRGLTHNIIGFFVIKHRRYFKEGFRIEIDGIIGDVIAINPINFTLLEVRNWLSSDSNTGRIIEVPNSIIFEKTMEKIDPESRYIKHEVQYTLSYDSDWGEAENIMKEAGASYYKEILLPSLKEQGKYLFEEETKAKPVFSLNTDKLGIIVTLRYLVDYKNGTGVRTYLQREILSKFEADPNIKFAVSDIRILSDN